MKVIYTCEAIDSLEGILAFIATNYTAKSAAFEKRQRTAVMRIGAWPESAEEVAERPGVRVVPLIRYPYKVFYRVTSGAVEILYIHHAARRAPWEGER
jgi:toxin ParE1/3/4